jgi:hypothetical protein
MILEYVSQESTLLADVLGEMEEGREYCLDDITFPEDSYGTNIYWMYSYNNMLVVPAIAIVKSRGAQQIFLTSILHKLRHAEYRSEYVSQSDSDPEAMVDTLTRRGLVL